MIEPPQLLTFALASLALALTPGPDLIYVVLRGAAQGAAAGITAALGLATGILGHTLLCMLGVSALLMASTVAFTVVKFIGAAYLIYLGVSMWRHSGHIDFSNPAPAKPLFAIYRQTILMNLLNPKVALFFLAFLPQFVDPQAGNAALQLGLLGLVFLTIGLIVMTSAGIAGGVIKRFLLRDPRMGSWMEKVAGSLIVGLGVTVAFQQNR